jgi:hypothetical protein
MKRVSKMVLKMYLPPAAIAVGGIVLSEVLSRAGDLIGPRVSFYLAAGIGLVSLLTAFVWACSVSWQLYRWMQGREQRCDCGGLLSRIRTARSGAHYRKCMSCGARIDTDAVGVMLPPAVPEHAGS